MSQWSTLSSGPLARAFRPEKGDLRRKWMSQWSTLSSGPLARAFRPEKGWFRLKLDGPVTLSFKQTPCDSQQVRLDVIFTYIEQAQMEKQAKDQIWVLVNKDLPLAYKMLELQGLGLEPELVAPVIELLVTEEWLAPRSLVS